MATAEVQEIRATSYVGFDSITQQIEHKLLKRGFQFNVIVVGASCGLFLVSQTCCNPRKRKIFIKRGSGHQVKPVWESRPSSTPYLLHTSSTRRAGVRLMSLCVRLRKFRRSLMVRSFLCYFSAVTLPVASLTRIPDLVITENGVRLRLNIVDTPGYGDQVNNENWCATYSCSRFEGAGIDRRNC
jgi:hypothetical protein